MWSTVLNKTYYVATTTPFCGSWVKLHQVQNLKKTFVLLRAFVTSWQTLGNHHAPQGIPMGKTQGHKD